MDVYTAARVLQRQFGKFIGIDAERWQRNKFNMFVQVKLRVNISLKKRRSTLRINNLTLLNSDAIC